MAATKVNNLPGFEVSCRNHMILLDKLRGQDALLERLLEGLPYTFEHLANKNERIDWSSTRRMLQNACSIWSEAELEEIGRRIPLSPFVKPILLVAGMFYSPVDVYRWLFGESSAAQQLITCIQPTIRIAGSDRLEIDFAVLDGYEVCHEMFFFLRGALTAVPTMIGCPAADVTRVDTDRGARFEIVLSRRRPLLRRCADRLARIWPRPGALEELREAHELLHQRHAELRQNMEQRAQAEKALQESEQQLHQAQKLEAVGQLAGGIAHDFNNLLCVIVSCSEMLKTEMQRGGRSTEDIDEILQAAQRGTSLTDQLLSYSRSRLASPEQMDVNQVISETVQMLRRIFGDNIELQLNLGQINAKVTADSGQVHQLLMNLAINAKDAMPDGGVLHVRTRFSESFAGREHQPTVRLEVSDTGHGIPVEIRDKIFEPFFTTKPEGAGSGLGLSTVHGTVKRSGGEIRVDAECRQGTKFIIDFPASLATATAAIDEPLAPATPLGNTRILFAEDNDQVRRTVSKMLETHGFEVITATNGIEALAAAERIDGSIHLLLTDVVMPRISAAELVTEFHRRHPDTAILFLSGFIGEHLDLEEMVAMGDGFLAKPVTTSVLVTKIRQLVEAAQPIHPAQLRDG